jgi:uncharacterized protein
LLNLRNDIYFEHYYTRLKDAFSSGQYEFAIKLLARTARENTIPAEILPSIGGNQLVEKDMAAVVESLMYDGYIFFDPSQRSYRFQSTLLQEWWNKKTPQP